MEQTTINQRLNILVEFFEGGKKAAFARKVGITSQGAQELLAGRKGAPSFKVLTQILDNYPTVNANWLVMGRGPMLHEGEARVIDPFAGTGSFITPEVAQSMQHQREADHNRLSKLIDALIKRDPALGHELRNLLSDDSN